MKAVLVTLAAMILLPFSTMASLAAEPELSIDYFWGDGELTSDPAKKTEWKTKCGPNNNSNTPLSLRSDLNGVILGLRYPIGRFRPAVEFGSGSEDGNRLN